MTIPNKLQLSVSTSGFDPARLSKLVDVFHSWISQRALPEVLVDVADYRHVIGGPALVLVGLDSNYGVWVRGGHVVLSCFRKRWQSAAVDPLLDVTTRTFRAAALLESALLSDDARFDGATLELEVYDRLATDVNVFDDVALAGTVEQRLSTWCASEARVTRCAGRARPTFTARFARPKAVADLWQALEQRGQA